MAAYNFDSSPDRPDGKMTTQIIFVLPKSCMYVMNDMNNAILSKTDVY